MTDLPASWQTDPTGRHDHRYWDGTAWTDHVADAGVADTDPYVASDSSLDTATPAAPASDSTTTAPTPAAASSWGGPSTPTPAADASTSPAADPSPAPGPAAGWGAPTTPGTSSPTPPVTPAPGLRTGWGDAPTTVTPGVSGDAPTSVTPVPGWAAGDPSSASAGTGAEAGATDPEPADPGGPAGSGDDPADTAGDGHRRRNLLIAGAVVVVIALIAFLAINGSDSNGREAVEGRIVDSLRDSESSLSKKDARCMADHIVDEVGAERLKDVDFDADQAPTGRLGTDLISAYASSVEECDVSDTSLGGSTPGSSNDGNDLGSIGDIDKFKDLLADQYAATLGLSTKKARCLADALGDAVRSGELRQDDAFGDFFSYLDTCDISLDELTSAPG